MDGEKLLILYAIFIFGQMHIYPNIVTAPSTGGDSDASFSKSENCSQFNTCAYAKNVYLPNCYCDQLCHLYDDCCIDHNLSEEQLRQRERHDTKDRISVMNEECIPLYGSFLGAYQIRNIDKNSHNATRDIVATDGSGNIFDILPVTSTNDTVYSNRYIAESCGITEYKFWKILFDVTLCSLEGSIDNTGMSTTDIANDFLGQGCEYTVLPPDHTHTRFCIIFHSSDNITSNKRIPVRTSSGIFRSTESCMKYMMGEIDCEVCNNFRFEEQFASKFGSSMNALFTFPAYEHTLNDKLIKTMESSKVVFRNLKLKRQISATTSEVFNVAQWDRVAFFYQKCIDSALKEFEPYLDFYAGIYFENKTLTSGNFSAVFDIHLRKKINSENVLKQINTWLDKHKLQYIEIFENGSVLYEIMTPRPDSTYGCPNCKFVGYFKKKYDGSDRVIEIMKSSKSFPTRNCLEIQGMVVITKDKYSFSVKCQSPKFVVFNKPDMKVSSIMRYVFSCLSLIFLCSVLPCYQKSNVRNTVLGYSYLLLLFVSFFNQIVTTFIEQYSTSDICYVMDLISRTLILMIQTTAVMGSASFIYFVIRIKSTANEALLKNIVHTCSLIGISLFAPIVLALMISQLSETNAEDLTSCGLVFFSSIFSYAMTTLVISLVALVVSGIIIYKTKENENLCLVKSCIRFESAYTSIAILALFFFSCKIWKMSLILI